eukprot:TRINITY_DN63303_c0_g1_i1.p1 TRINITY_DN63303_c0_g1~~TRINITY_DN63303_c0_g1_i1.p1  ORF type:complete len:676 (+),score=80.47 TRINITY_DN63303_c0_g1_i1:93-2120(+)
MWLRAMWLGSVLLLCCPSLTIAAWDYTGELPTWRSSFPDFDCRRHTAGDSLDWDSFRRKVEAASPSDFPKYVQENLAKVPWERNLDKLQDLVVPECPLGLLFMIAVRYGDCAAVATNIDSITKACPESEYLANVAQHIFRMTTWNIVELLLGTRWPLLVVFSGLRLRWYENDSRLSCLNIEDPVLDWNGLRVAFSSDDWFHEAKPFVYNRHFQANWVFGMEECTYGVAMVSLWKLIVCAETQAECVSQYSIVIEDLIKSNDWREVVGNSWNMFGFLARVHQSIRRHEFQLDFLPAELQGKDIPGLPAASNLVAKASRQSHLARAVAERVVSVAFAGVLETVITGLPMPYVTRGADGKFPVVRSFLYITMVFGARYNAYIPRFVARASALGIDNLALFCLDAESHEICEKLPSARGSRCIRGTPSILNKFTLPLVYLHLNVDVFWLDFDVFLLRDPTALVLDAVEERQVDLLVSGSFADDCICSGLVFFKATDVVAEWLMTVLSWMYEHVYTHDQQAFSAFLAGRPDEDNATTPERIASSKLFRLYLHPEVPRWALLDPVVQFASARVLNTTGWTGDLSDMFIFHFLHGDSEVNRGHSAYGWNARHGFLADRAILDVFYNQSDEDVYNKADPPHEQNAEIRDVLLSSRRKERPSEMLHCGVLQLNEYSPGRMSPDG